MKKALLTFISLFCVQTANAANLIEVFNQALQSDPIYQQAIAQRLATKQGVPISLANLLPSMSVSWDPSLTRSGFSGTNFATGASPRNNTLRAYSLTLTASQTVFNFSQFMNLAGALATSKGADATLNAALQDLMVRVSSAYFQILQDEDNLTYAEATKLAFQEQLEQMRQQQKVGLKTITDVYTAQASYDSAVASFIAAQTALANDRENLRVITGKYYDNLSPLSENFPLVSPEPSNMEKWVRISLAQNWTIKASQYAAQTAKDNISQQLGGHLPTVTVNGTIDRQFSQNINGYMQALNQRNGPSTQTDRSVMVDVTFPLLAGGGVVAASDQAEYNYEVAQQQLEQTQRGVVNSARQNYMNIIQGISQVKADRQAIKSTVKSLEGLEESYKVGTETLVDVLNQQQKVFEAQVQYAQDRYAFVNSVLALKQAAGTLSFDDLRAINTWLMSQRRPHKQLRHIKIKPHQYSHKKPRKKAVHKKKVATKSTHVTKKKVTAKKKPDAKKRVTAKKKRTVSKKLAARKHAHQPRKKVTPKKTLKHQAHKVKQTTV